MLAYLFVVLAVAVHIRWIALPFSFTPVIAALLYFGARMPRKQMWIPVLMLAASDVYLTRVTYGYSITADHFVTWGFYAAAILLGAAMIKGFSAVRIGATTLIGSVSFFLISNFAVWAVWSLYPKTLGGLAACYVAGLPFFRNAVASDLFFSAAFFGIGYLVSERMAAREAVAVSRR
ncbi:MAG TPA: DUF6580 family putative transport protein [Terriglobales bacterium]|nr:DUF6580 family putative transport protein [Terriglobales bacterium]